MTHEEFKIEHERLTSEFNLIPCWNCDYPPLATGLDYYKGVETNENYLFTISGCREGDRGLITKDDNYQLHIDLLEESLKEYKVLNT